MSNPIAEVFDTFFNGRPAPKHKPGIDWAALIRRKVSHVLVGGKTYKVTVEPVVLKAEATQ